MRYFTSFTLILGLVLGNCLSAPAAEWGSLKGRLVFDGTADKPDAIKVTKDTEFCSEHKLVEEQLVVSEKGGLANVFIYLYLKRGKKVDIHPDLAKPSDEPIVLDNKGCRFEPHAIVVRTDQPLEIKNSDEGIGHNTNAQTLRANPKFNEQVTNASSITKKFSKSEAFPAEVACNVHPWMKAYMLVRDNPYMAVTDAEGNFEIKNLPAGKHQFVFWHEVKGNIRDLKLGDAKTDRKGRAKITIEAGETLDLGEVKVAGSKLGL